MACEPPPPVGHDGWHQHACEQRRAWLALSPRQRLRWLEQAKAFAALARRSVGSPPSAPVGQGEAPAGGPLGA